MFTEWAIASSHLLLSIPREKNGKRVKYICKHCSNQLIETPALKIKINVITY